MMHEPADTPLGQNPENNRPYNFEFLLTQIASDDLRLREELVHSWYRFVRSFASAMIVDPDRADYAILETFKRAWASLDQYPTGTDFSAWITKISLQSCKHQLKGPRKTTGADGRWNVFCES